MAKEKVAGIILYNERVLIGRRKIRKDISLSGEWEIPSTCIIDSESDFDALERMARTSVGVQLSFINYICNSKVSAFYTRWYECPVKSNKLKCGKFWDNAEWVDTLSVFNRISERVKKTWPDEIINYFGGC